MAADPVDGGRALAPCRHWVFAVEVGGARVGEVQRREVCAKASSGEEGRESCSRQRWESVAMSGVDWAVESSQSGDC